MLWTDRGQDFKGYAGRRERVRGPFVFPDDEYQ